MLHTVRASLTMRWGINVIGRAEPAEIPRSQVRADGRRWGPLSW